jgi:hypothetical protein
MRYHSYWGYRLRHSLVSSWGLPFTGSEGLFCMSKSTWNFPPPTVIKRAVEAVQRSGLPVTGVRVSKDAVYVETSAAAKEEPPASDNGPLEL